MNDRIFKNTQAYALAKQGEYLKRFFIYLRTAETLSIPYALLPIILLTCDQSLIIHTHDLQIKIYGRGLEKLQEVLHLEQLKYIREDPSGTDEGILSVFIKQITIDGEILKYNF